MIKSVKDVNKSRLPENKNNSTVNVRIKFQNLSEEQQRHLFAAEACLARAGISFDTGAGCHGRDWEFDWSLHGAEVHLSRVQPSGSTGEEASMSCPLVGIPCDQAERQVGELLCDGCSLIDEIEESEKENRKI